MINGRPWLLTSSFTDELQKIYDKYKLQHSQVMEDSLRKWWKQLDPDIESHLNKNIIVEEKTNDCYNPIKLNMAE